MEKEYKFYPEDFPEHIAKPKHYDLHFDVFDDHTYVTNDITFKAVDDVKEVVLNAHDLDVKKVESELPMKFEYSKKEHKIFITFHEPVKKGTEFKIHTESIFKPTKNILEGAYFDETPEGAPPTMISQCQQWGFQRMVPCIDEMNAKSTYITRITADSRYTNLITNGDVTEERHSVSNGRDTIVYSNTKTPMASYLFIFCVGTYDTYTKEFEYPNGDTFNLELVVIKGAEKEPAEKALDMLYNGVMWMHVSTGKDKYKHLEEKKKIYELVKKRDALKAKGEDASDVRAELKALAEPLHLGYTYTGTVYREIAMQNSNVGGMENVGNTTITANMIMPYKLMPDGAFAYMIGVKLHEFYHNLNGSEVTGHDPFQLWLNEAVVMHVQGDYENELFGENYQRLGDVIGFLAPGGTFEEDTSAKSMPIEPPGFNTPDELITSMTYVKAPQFVKMIEILMGKEKFVEGLELYHTRFKHSNATRKDWIDAMQEVSGQDFTRMADVWLKNPGHPLVEVTESYDDGKLTVHLKQTNAPKGKHWEFPFALAIFDEKGKKIEEKMVRINDVDTDIVFETEKPGFVSLNRGYTFFGKVLYEPKKEDLMLQVEHDDDVINKYMAFYKIADAEKLRLMKDPEAEVSEEFMHLFHSLLSNKKVVDEVGSLIIAITEGVEDDRYGHKYEQLFQMREKLFTKIAHTYKSELMNLYHEYASKKIDAPYVEREIFNMKNRGIKNTCLAILSRLDDEEMHGIIKKQLDSEAASDIATAFSLYLRSSAPDRMEIFERMKKQLNKNLVGHSLLVNLVARNEADDALDLIKKMEKDPSFKIDQSNDQYLYIIFAHNKRKSLQTEEGLNFAKESLIKLAQLNEYHAVALLDAFGKIDYLMHHEQVAVVQALLDVFKTLDEQKSPSVYHTLKRLLKNSPKALAEYESVKGKVTL